MFSVLSTIEKLSFRGARVVFGPWGPYRAFVVMCFWNWFATGPLRSLPVSFFEALGLVWLSSLLFPSQEVPISLNLFTNMMIDLLVPDEKRKAADGIAAQFEMDAQLENIGKTFGSVPECEMRPVSTWLGGIVHWRWPSGP